MQENPHGGSYTTGGSSSSTAGCGSVLPPIDFILDLDGEPQAEPKPPPAVKAKPRTVPLTPPVMQPPPAAMMQPPPVMQPPPKAPQQQPPQEPPQMAEPDEAPEEEPEEAADPNTLPQPNTPSVPTIDPEAATDSSTRDPSGSSRGSTE